MKKEIPCNIYEILSFHTIILYPQKKAMIILLCAKSELYTRFFYNPTLKRAVKLAALFSSITTILYSVQPKRLPYFALLKWM